MKYRPDIDGLRAIAVLAVMLFHGHISGFSGGYVGVDVFFVVSGFLITSIVLADVEKARFSFLQFYDRRARRILPALVVVVLSSFVAAWLLLLPNEAVDFGQSVTSIGAFASNGLFWIKSGYFAGPAHETPLLHTWSLAVEEQFYFVWPAAILLLHRFVGARSFRTFFLVLIGLSFVASEWMVRRSATTAFFLAPFRAWELAMGGLLALPNIPRLANKLAAEVLSLLGLGLIVWSTLTFNEATVFPGMSALAPTIGTTLLLYSGAECSPRVTRLLSWRPLVAIGLISYSLYLWHWPLLVFPSLHLSRLLSSMEAGFALVLSIALAGLTWKFVERPFRKRSSDRVAMRKVVVSAALASVALGALGLGLVFTRGLPSRLPQRAQDLVALAEQRNPLGNACLYTDGPLPAIEQCTLGVKEQGRHGTVLWGDSHADHFGPAVDEAGLIAGMSARQLSMSACPPLIGATRVDHVGKREGCNAFNQLVLHEILGDTSVKVVILAARWSLYSETDRPKGEAGGPTYLTDSSDDSLTAANSRRALTVGLRQTVDLLRAQGLEVILFGQVPESEVPTAKCLARAAWHDGSSSECDIVRATIDERLAYSNDLLLTLSKRVGVRSYLPSKRLCGDVNCASAIGDVPLFYDRHHLNAAGARLLGPQLVDEIWGISKPTDGLKE